MKDTDRKPRRGGQEPPAWKQDRPEQNAGYDEAVRSADRPVDTAEDMEVEAITPDDEEGLPIRETPGMPRRPKA